MSGIRINRFLANAGLGSRRYCEGLVRSGEIRVNGELCEDLARRILEEDRVEYKGQLLNGQSLPLAVMSENGSSRGASKREASEGGSLDGSSSEKGSHFAAKIWMFHKPRGCLCTRFDPEGRQTIWDHLDHLPPPFQAVGRLDHDSSGLLLICADGSISNRLMHPRYEVTKIYQVRATGQWKKGMADKLKAGVQMVEGGMGQAKPLSIRTFAGGVDLKLELKRGKKREIRYSLRALGLEVQDLHRVKLGSLSLGDLKVGSSRALSENEIQLLADSISLRDKN